MYGFRTMQAVILSGGFGTRLRPLTYTRPKPLMPMGETTLLGNLIKIMPKSVDKVILASNYLIDQIREYVAKNDFGVEVVVVEEKEPLGTGGAIKNCQSEIDDTFIVFNGDLITSIDLEEFVRFHKEKGGIGTISLWEVEDPTAFGVIGTEEDGRIYKFKEKPKPEEVFSNKINAGCYVLEPEIFGHIEADKKVSIEREVFPFIIDKGLYGMPFSGYWIDSGTQPLYLGAQKILLETKGLNVYLGENVEASGSAVGGFSVIYDNVGIGQGCRITGSTIFPGSSIGQDTVIERSIIGEKCSIGNCCHIPRGCIIGDGYVLDDGTKLEENTRLPLEE